ncbi:MAG: crossover junction endodeoxyribonuclease RuvC [Chloroflexota bacterium]
MTLVLAIDPGTATIGFALVQDSNHGDHLALDYGVITTPKGDQPANRLMHIYQEINKLIVLHKPNSAAIEKLYFSQNTTTAIAVGQARGVILLAMAQAGLEIGEYSPNEIKQAVTGYGFAEKRQVQEMVKVLLSLDKIPKPDDAADALAIAITHLNTKRYTE